MQTDHTTKQFRIAFDSLADLIHYLDTTPAEWSINQSAGNRAEKSWDLGVGLGGAMRLARDGWADGVDMVNLTVAHAPVATLYVTRYDVAGERPDVARAVAGLPANMVRRGKVQRPRPTLTIAVGIAASSAVPASAMVNYGAAMLTLIDRLENRGVRVELLGVWSSVDLRGGGESHVTWTIKRAQDHVDLAALAFSLAHPAMLRRVGFAVMERAPMWMQTHSYGVPTQSRAANMVGAADDNTLIIQGVGTAWRECSTYAGALAHAESQINVASVKLFNESLAELSLDMEEGAHDNW